MNIDLTKILANAPVGLKLYSTLHGEVLFQYIHRFRSEVVVKAFTRDGGFGYIRFQKDGRYFKSFPGECVLFPSKDNRDWTNINISQ